MSKLQDVRKSKVVKITLSDDKERELKYTLNSFAEMEDKYGSVDKAIEAMQNGSIKAVRFMIYAGLIDCGDIKDERHLGSLLNVQDIEALTEKMTEAMSADLPEEMIATGKENPNV